MEKFFSDLLATLLTNTNPIILITLGWFFIIAIFLFVYSTIRSSKSISVKIFGLTIDKKQEGIVTEKTEDLITISKKDIRTLIESCANSYTNITYIRKVYILNEQLKRVELNITVLLNDFKYNYYNILSSLNLEASTRIYKVEVFNLYLDKMFYMIVDSFKIMCRENGFLEKQEHEFDSYKSNKSKELTDIILDYMLMSNVIPESEKVLLKSDEDVFLKSLQYAVVQLLKELKDICITEEENIEEIKNEFNTKFETFTGFVYE